MIASTRLLVRDIIDGFEVDPDHVRRIPGGIDPEWWRTAGPGEHSTSRRDGTVLAWGRVQYEKGFQVLARAIAALRHRTGRDRVHDSPAAARTSPSCSRRSTSPAPAT